MASVPRPRVIRTVLNRPGIKKMMQQEHDAALKEIAVKIVAAITPLYEDENGQPYRWLYRIEHDRRTTRASLLIYCNKEEVRHKEAAKGLIAKHLRTMSIRGRVRIIAGASGVKFK